MAERIVERVLNRLHRDAEAHRRVAINLHEPPEPVFGLIRGHVPQFRHAGQPRQQTRHPSRQFLRVRIHQRVLVLRSADAGADLDILDGLEIGGQAGHIGNRFCHARDHHGRRIAFADRAQSDGQTTGVGRGIDGAGPDEGHHARDRRVLPRDLRHSGLQIDQMGNGDAFRTLGHRQQDAGILGRQEAFRHDDVEANGPHQRGYTDQQDEGLVAEGPA